MNIAEKPSFDKKELGMLQKLFLALVIILIASLSFGLGLLLGGEGKEGIRVEYDASLSQILPTADQASAIKAASEIFSGNIVASKNGKRYHYQHCPGAKQITEANKIFFKNEADAEASGYTLAANCAKR